MSSSLYIEFLFLPSCLSFLSVFVLSISFLFNNILFLFHEGKSLKTFSSLCFVDLCAYIYVIQTFSFVSCAVSVSSESF